ncbi:pantetheine-phosphate adenylyltransferase [Desulfonatronovibrio magnus]|uniref:pantetheine-phosphate adenylyltransferase n=1 Tax=Desulfonatronovibrio magnus TaxID=698827 RepID=UPI0005EAC885|nr:pantetheine-phosphate adenylyltransferase [Desulfonatronovibrio magnus]RQD59742.1 MAG: pantetheine-phosphate adenylyltransferase [Desulfonatronovibrio sp. MSAO_Bac4]
MEKTVKSAVYPGTFDPMTNGHVSLILRGLDIFDEILVAVALHSPKNPLFTLDERVEMAREIFDGKDRIKVEPFEGLLVEYVKERKAVAILRGMRAVADFEYEFQMALMNRRLDRNIHTVFLMTEYKWLYISSTIIKDVARLGGEIKGLVPPNVEKRLYARYGHQPKDKIS